MSDVKSFLKEVESWKGSPDFNLKSISRVLDELGNPQDAVRSFHVAGTNGKGSTSTMIASGISAAGYSVGLNTSPHLVDFSERLIVNGKSVGEEKLKEAIHNMRTAMEQSACSLSFHEGVTTLAFLLFQDLDFGVFETGLGGRLDSSNVLKSPEASVITTIGRDHEHILGDSIEKIAFEKAGIIKEKGTLVLGRVEQAAAEVIRSVAMEKGASVLAYDESFTVEVLPSENSIVNRGKFVSATMGDLEFELSLPGQHQLHNAGLATAALKHIGISDKSIQQGLVQSYWPARFEVLSGSEIKRTVIVDCAHNPDGFKVLRSALKTRGVEQFEVALGFLQTKRWQEMLDIIHPGIVHWHIVEPSSARKVPADELEEEIQRRSEVSCSEISNYGSDYDSFIAEVLYRESDVPLLVCGSIYMIGEIYRRLTSRRSNLW